MGLVIRVDSKDRIVGEWDTLFGILVAVGLPVDELAFSSHCRDDSGKLTFVDHGSHGAAKLGESVFVHPHCGRGDLVEVTFACLGGGER